MSDTKSNIIRQVTYPAKIPLRVRSDLPTIRFEKIEQLESKMAAIGFTADQIFFKGRHTPYLPLTHYRHTNLPPHRIIFQFVQLGRIYSVVPENTAAPILMAVKNSDVVGYCLEYIEGKPLSNFYFTPDKNKREKLKHIFYDKLVPPISRLHQSGIGHGDLSPSNIIVTPTMKIMLIDPASHPKKGEAFRIHSDMRELRSLERRLSA